MPMDTRRKHSGEFKQLVIETMHKERLSYMDTSRRFGVNDRQVRNWEKLYLEEGADRLYHNMTGKIRSPRRGRPKSSQRELESAEENLAVENQKLRAENDYLKKLQALVQKREQREKEPRQSGS